MSLEALCLRKGRRVRMMRTPSNKKRGLYVSYNEKKNGTFDGAVQVSNRAGRLTWLDKSRRRPEELHYPTYIVIRLTGQERYFRGVLDAVKSAEDLDPDFALKECDHRPSAWRERQK